MIDNGKHPFDSGYFAFAVRASESLLPFDWSENGGIAFAESDGAEWRAIQRERLVNARPFAIPEGNHGGIPEHINGAIRAWHDWTHFILGLGFDHESECFVVASQADYMHANGATRHDTAVMVADGLQTAWHGLTGEYPADQRAFNSALAHSIQTGAPLPIPYLNAVGSIFVVRLGNLILERAGSRVDGGLASAIADVRRYATAWQSA